jgi:hypothetical protein
MSLTDWPGDTGFLRFRWAFFCTYPQPENSRQDPFQQGFSNFFAAFVVTRNERPSQVGRAFAPI